VGQHVTFPVTLLSEPVQKGNYQTFSIFARGHFRVLVKVLSSEKLQYGDTLMLEGILTATKLGGKDMLLLDKPTVTHLAPTIWLSFLSGFRERSKQLYSQILSPDQASLLLGIVYGIKSPMSYRFSQAIQSVGLTHVSAASGMNVTLLTGFLGKILIIFMKRQKTVGVIIGILLIYMVLSGMQGSILRATFMGGGAILAGILGRQRQGLYLLCITAYVLLFISPLLLQDLGFQLSFLATLGILLFSPLLEGVVAGRILLEDFATSWCAQVFSLPLILVTFGHYNPLSLMVNMLVLWVVAPLMILGGVASIIGIFTPALSYVLLALCIPLLWYFQSLTLYFAKFQTNMYVTSLSLPFILCYYSVAGGGYFFMKRYQNAKTHKQG
jgi:competence protein ComEC